MGTGTPIGRVRGLGSAKEGTHHWWRQRLTAASNLLLMLWFIFSVARMTGYDHASVHAWLRSAWVAVPMILLVVIFFKHAMDGLKTVIDDYIDDEGGRMMVNGLVTFAGIGAGSLALFSIAKIAFGA